MTTTQRIVLSAAITYAVGLGALIACAHQEAADDELERAAAAAPCVCEQGLGTSPSAVPDASPER